MKNAPKTLVIKSMQKWALFQGLSIGSFEKEK